MRTRSLLRNGFWVLIALVLVAHLGGGWYFSGVLIDDEFTPQLSAIVAPASGVDVTPVSYDSPAGDFDAWLVPANGSTWVIHVHGRRATPSEAEHLFVPLRDAGYPQLAITYRNDEGQPRDASGYYQYGATEWEDVGGAIDYAVSNGASAVVLSGFSSGASHILSFIYKNNLDVVSGLMFDSPNIDFGDTVDHNASQREMPLVPVNVPGSVAQVAKFITSLRIGVNWKSLDYVDKTDRALHVPVLVHHGTADLSVPIQQSIRFADQSPELIRLVQVRDAGHVESYDLDPEGYVDEVLDFLDRLS